jgi:hypothetical protein
MLITNIIENNKCASILFLFLVISCLISNNKISEISLIICSYFLFKWAIDSTKCTISYIECKLRGVKKEEGYLYQLLTPIINLNKSKYIYWFVIGLIMISVIHLIKIKFLKF